MDKKLAVELNNDLEALLKKHNLQGVSAIFVSEDSFIIGSASVDDETKQITGLMHTVLEDFCRTAMSKFRPVSQGNETVH